MSSNLSESYKRWRHTRGYGVHSPFAYSLVKGVVRPGRGYAWYGYEAIEEALLQRSSAKIRRETRMLLRLASFLNIDSAFLPGGDDTQPYLIALLASNSRIKIETAPGRLNECRLICTSGELLSLGRLKEALQEAGTVIAARRLPPEWITELYESMSEGLLLQGKHNIILIHRPDMQKLTYTVRL